MPKKKAVHVQIRDQMAVPTQPVEGLFFDELSKIRVLEPDTADRTQELKDECKEFVDRECSRVRL